ncbi:MAG TPA: phospholipase [Granulicella sp.]
MTAIDPHAHQPVLYAGAAVERATAAMVLLHGRGASAESILALASEFQQVETAATRQVAFAAPQAAGFTWYPNSFLAPRDNNEPWLSSALAKVESVVAGLVEAGIARDRIFISGFSQGACLSTEFVASHPARYAGLIAFTGGLVGPLGSDLTHPGKLDGTPALLLSGDPDPHVPWSRVEESKQILEQMGAVVQAERFPGRPHTISYQELAIAQTFVKQILETLG